MKRFFDFGHVARSVAAVLLICALPAGAATRQILTGQVPAAVHSLTPTGSLPGETTVNVTIGLPLRNRAALTNLLADLYNPASPKFHQYLTADQFAEMFGPTKADYLTLIDFAKTHNLEIVGTHPNRTLLDVRAPASVIGAAFNVALNVFQHPTEARTFFAPNTEPSIEIGTSVLSISGLDNYNLPKSMMHKKAFPAAKSSAPALGTGVGGTYLGTDFRKAYLPNVVLDGTGQSVALLEYDGYFPNDITTYESLAGLPAVPLTNVFINGYNGAAGGNNGEVALDIEMAIALAPGLSNIIVYEALNDGGSILPIINRIATDNAARQISSSWGGGAFSSSADQAFQQMAAQGQSFFNASGDYDATAQVLFAPCDDPYVISVGGTTLSTAGPGGPYQSETVWNWGGGVGSSGGVSGTYQIPTWQQGIDMTTNLGSLTLRNFPDVSFVADNIFIIADNGQQEDVGGTSAASPLWAAFMALVNQQAVNVGHPSLGFINPAVYSIAKGANYANTFHDITTGDNTSPFSPSHYFAYPGYDLCTGWGSPSVGLINTLVPLIPEPFLLVQTNIVNGGNANGLVDYNECNAIDIQITNAGTASATSVQGFISTTTPGVTVATPSAIYPDIAPGTAAFGRTSFRISTTPNFVCGTTVNLTLVLKSAQTTFTNTVLLPSGLTGKSVTFTNANQAVTIPDNDPNGLFSPVFVSGVDSPIRRVTASVYLTHTFDADLRLELVGPDGTTVLLSANEGGSGDNYGGSCSPDSLRTTFDDTATLPISSGNAPFVGMYRPEQTLAAFGLKTGTAVNGIWNLHCIDQIGLDQGTLQCWSLSIYPSVCLDGGGECPGADLGITMTATPNPVRVGSNLTYTITVTNNGPGTAKGIIVNQTLATNCVFVSATSSQGTASFAGGIVSASLGTMQVGATSTVSVVVYPTSAGNITSTANVGSPTADFNTANNTVSLTTSVQFPTADVGVTMTGSSVSVLGGGLLTYTLNVTNNGPFTASGVSLAIALPPNCPVISTANNQGTLINSGSSILVQFGDVPTKTNIVVSVVIRAATIGLISATAQISVGATTVDPVVFNNSATVSTTVTPAADVGVTIVSSPNPVITGSNFTYFIAVTNNGPSDATTVVMSQVLPNGLPLVAASVTIGTFDTNTPGSVTWQIPSLLNGGGGVLSLTVTAPTNASPPPLTSTVVVSADQGDANTTNNTAISATVVAPPTVTIIAAGTFLTAESIAPANGAIEPGETVTVQFGLQNIGNIPTVNLTATLLAVSGVTLPSGTQTYGVVTPGSAAVSKPFTFTAAGTNGGSITAVLQVTDGALYTTNVSFTFPLPVVSTFSNTAPIVILDNGPASLYPSRILVTNFTGFVGKVSVTISNMNHTFPDDVDILLVHPSGRSSILMSDAGGSLAMVNVSPTFDRTGTSVIPDASQIVTATYQPFDYESGDIFPTNAPVGPYTANLSAFEGINPNGNWSLYVMDDTVGDVGVISNGWSLTFTAIAPVNKISDLAVSGTSSPTNQFLTGASVRYTVTVTNNGPDAATAVILTNTLPAGVNLTSAVVSQGSYIQNGQTLKFSLGSIPASNGVTITLNGTITGYGTLTDTMGLGGNEIDPNLANNSGSIVIGATLPPADVAVTGSASPTPVIVGSNLVYTLVAVNNGPNTALNVTGAFPHTNMTLVSAITTQGTVSNSNNILLCNFGNIANANSVIVTVIVTPTVVGLTSNIWSVTSGSTDANLTNNSAAINVSVNPPTPIIAAGATSLISESGVQNGAVDSGETVNISFTLSNVGVAATTNLVATLQSSGGVTPITTSRNYGALNPGASASQPFSFQATGAAGSNVTATFALLDNAYSLGTVTFTFTIPATILGTNATGLVIPSSGAASPYPSVINLSGLNGLVTKVVVNITGFTHSFPDDADVMLVNPTGQRVVLMSDVGGAHSVSNLNFTFSDSASSSLPDSDTLVSGSYKPTDFEPGDLFPGFSGPLTGSTLSALNGFSPNGNWSLYVVDDTTGDGGSISNWTLSVTTASTINPAANLSVTATDSPNPVSGGNYVTYAVVVVNNGPGTANNVVLTNTLPLGTTLVSVNTSQGSASTNLSGIVTCAFGTISANGSAVASIRVRTSQSGSITNLSVVASDAIDLNPADSMFLKVTTVLDAPSASLLASSSAGSLRLTLIGEPNQPYAVQVTTNLVPPIVWTSVATNQAGPDGTFIYTDAQTNSPGQFYRAMRLSQ